MKKLRPTTREPHVFVCHGKRCTTNGAPAVRGGLRRALRELGLRARITRTSCQDYCKRGPVVFVEAPERHVWGRVSEEDVPRLAAKLARRARRNGDG